MARPPAISPSEKAKIVLSVLVGDLTIAAAGRSVGVSGQAVSNWRRQFIESGSRALMGEGKRMYESENERRLLQQVAELRSALGEVHVQLRTQQRTLAAGAHHRSRRVTGASGRVRIADSYLDQKALMTPAG